MFRSIPCANRLCFDRDLKQACKVHRSHIKNLRASITSKAASTPKFIREKLKPRLLERQREDRIQEENVKLAERINSLRIPRNRQRVCRTSKPTYENEYNLQLENKRLAVRLLSMRSSYSVKKYLKQHEHLQQVKSNISLFPTSSGYQSHKTAVNVPP
jgi:hypothetical protein